ncbi:MAG: hypothetical protein HQ510_09805 [Candidatus Marinimicrobia bacterium]|nr:hypothetical protein [Candidatus Neomarinimicrobiota bacterium]
MKVINKFILFVGFTCLGFTQTTVEMAEISGLNYPCNACHANTGWTDLTLTGFHHDSTGFQLRDAHEYVNCRACHTGESLLEVHQFGQASDQCQDCHQDIHHGQLGNTCETCHSPTTWFTNRDGFRHELTVFPLTDSHLGVECRRCHPAAQEGSYRGASVFCADCHQNENTQADLAVVDHNMFSDQCEYCHNPDRWEEPAMDHARSGYPLIGKHNSAECNSCHVDQYIGTDIECFVCHFDEYSTTTEPVHIEKIYPLTECKLCHDPRTWSNSIYSHQPEPEICSLCHISDWFAANQTVLGHFSLPNQCASCHTPRAWDEFSFDHSLTSFDLSGMHLATTCLLCHENGFYLTPTECSDCHIDEFNATTDPSHLDEGFFPEECESCHNTLGWEPATFHDPSKISICSDCHDYNGITDPLPILDHNTAFKLGDEINNCTFCHQNANDWLDTNMPHSVHDDSDYGIYFNIFSGTHGGKGDNSCSVNCHVFGRFDTFSCYESCHEGSHSKSSCQSEHCEGNSSNCESCNGSNGYWIVNQQYFDGSWGDESTFLQCYECHPNGNMSGGCANDIAQPFNPRLQPVSPKIKDNITK